MASYSGDQLSVANKSVFTLLRFNVGDKNMQIFASTDKLLT
jgi:hypothetical protein